MAKSLRCKSRVRARNIKREGYEKKELERLKKMIDKAKTSGTDDAEVKDIYNVKKSADVVRASKEKSEGMEHDGQTNSEFDHKTLKNKDGHYPVWMNQRAVKKHKKTLQKKQMLKRKSKSKKGNK